MCENDQIVIGRETDANPLRLQYPEDYELPDAVLTDMVFVRDAPEPADLIVVVGRYACRWGLDRRSEQALRLFHDGCATRFLCNGADHVDGGNRAIGASAAVYLAKALVRGGVPKRNVVVSRNRYWLGPLDGMRTRFPREEVERIQSIIVITSPIESRSMQLWGQKKAGEEKKLLVCPYQDGYTAENWTSTEGGRWAVQRTFKRLLYWESIGLLTSGWRRAVLEKHGSPTT